MSFLLYAFWQISKGFTFSKCYFKDLSGFHCFKLELGFSHDVDLVVPEGLEVKTPDQTTVEVSGIDKQAVGQFAAEIRKWRKPEPYKGKGIKYRGEYIFRKEGKKK